MELRPKRGGFTRPFGTAWFIREFLAGRGPHGAKQIDATTGAPQTDVFSAYKSALHQHYAENAVAKESEQRIKQGQPRFTTAEASERLEYYLVTLPMKSRGMTYNSFVKYFGFFRRLGWVEESGVVEPSSFQEAYPEGQPRIYYRLTAAGLNATEADLKDPVTQLYGYSKAERSRKRGK